MRASAAAATCEQKSTSWIVRLCETIIAPYPAIGLPGTAPHRIHGGIIWPERA